jgi:hypothetical protein
LLTAELTSIKRSDSPYHLACGAHALLITT